MALRTTRTGGQFWGCRNFPLCRGTRPLIDTESDNTGSDTTLPSERARERDRQRWRNET